ncbi:MAG: TerB family tellurite resistance protein [Myxococcota bacterium]
MPFPFFEPTDLDFEDVRVLTHAMMALARVDGVHDNEMALVRAFYESCARAGDPSLEEVAGGDFDPEQAKARFGEDEKKRVLFVKSLVLMAYADGRIDDKERMMVEGLAASVGVEGEELEKLQDATVDYMMGGLSHIKNVDALRAVRQSLD